jgi:hypothetical protein
MCRRPTEADHAEQPEQGRELDQPPAGAVGRGRSVQGTILVRVGAGSIAGASV